MVTGIVLLTIERKRINEVADIIADMQGVSEVYSIGGSYDLIAVIRVKDNERLADIVTNQLLKIDGIIKSETHIAFKVYSKHDLERMFSIGMT